MSHDVDINKICQELANSSNDGLEESYCEELKVLLTKCCGPLDGEDSSFLHALSSEYLILGLLSVKEVMFFLHKDVDLAISAVNTLIRFYEIPWDYVCKLCEEIPLTSDGIGKYLRNTLWNKRDTIGLSVKLGSLLLKNEPYLLEVDLVNVYLSMANIEIDVWKEEKNCCFVKWCSLSPETFNILTTLLNKFLVTAKFKNVILKIISDFIKNLTIECESRKTDLVMLYPLKLRSLVSLLVLEPECNPFQSHIKSKLTQLEKTDPKSALLLYSHFFERLE